MFIRSKVDFTQYKGSIYLEVSKTNRDCTRSSLFTVVFKDGAIVGYSEMLESRVGLGLKLFKYELAKLENIGIDNLEPFDTVE